MEEGQDNNPEKLTKACQEAFTNFPKSCSHAVWYVIKQYKVDQKWMSANDLVDHLDKNSDWNEIQISELSKLASDGVLVVGGAKESGNGHVIVVYPGESKPSGGFVYDKNGEERTARSYGNYALAMSTSMGSWPGAKSNGDKTVIDAWGAVKFRPVRFWKYVGPTNKGVSLLTPKRLVKTTAGAKTGQKQKRQVKKLRVKVKLKEKTRWSFKTLTDCFNPMTRKWQKVFQ